MKRALLATLMATVVAFPAFSDTLKIGVIGPMTGGGAAWGIAAKVGYEIAADEVNQLGGLKVGDKTYDVEVVTYDDKYQAAQAVASYNRMVHNDGIKHMMLMASASTMALKGNIEDDDVMAFTASYTASALSADTKHLVRVYSNPDSYAPKMIKWMAENIKDRRVVLLSPNDETGWDQMRIYKAGFEANGFDVAGEKVFERAATDFAAILTSIIDLKPEIIELGGTPPATAGLIVRQARDLGYKGRFTKMGGAGPLDIVAGAGKEASEGIINMLYADQSREEYKALVEKYKAASGHEPNEILLPFYDSAKVMLAAISAGGNVESAEAALAALPKIMPYKSLLGENLVLTGKDFYGVDMEIQTVNYIGEIRDGQPVVIGKAE